MSSADLPQGGALGDPPIHKGNDATRLALSRTMLAHDRTLMAWVRTSTSMISFGFTIYKFFQYLAASENTHIHTYFGPRPFALTMIGIGVLGLVFALIDHVRSLKDLEKEHGATYRSLTGKLAGILCMMGLGLMAVVLFRL